LGAAAGAASGGAARTAGITIGSPGLEIGIYCPDCQTVEVDLAAELDLVVTPSPERRTLDQSDEDDTHRYIGALVAKYSIPEIMRHNADLFSAAQPGAAELVRMMRRIADDRSTQFMTCESPAPTTVEQFTQVALGQRSDTQEKAATLIGRPSAPK
jgi:hypothetical protein